MILINIYSNYIFIIVNSEFVVCPRAFLWRQTRTTDTLYVCYPWYYSCRHKSRQVQKTVNCLMKKCLQEIKLSCCVLLSNFVSFGQQMQRLDQLGCPSVWLGYCATAPERLYSPQMSDMAEDATFTNYVVSTMVNKLSK